jgi:hypothetical protein
MLAGADQHVDHRLDGVLNRVSEDGVMTGWFRAPHRRFGTTYRMINLVVIRGSSPSSDRETPIARRGVRSASSGRSFKGLACSSCGSRTNRTAVEGALQPSPAAEIPVGLGVIAVILFSIAGINRSRNRWPRSAAWPSPRLLHRLRRLRAHQRAQTGAEAHVEWISFGCSRKDHFGARPSSASGNSLCVVRDYNTLDHQGALEMTHTGKRDRS